MGCMQLWAFIALGLCAIVEINGQEDADRKAKFSIFQIIKFKNDACVGGGNRNGTCYTAAECENLGGTEGASCADGFGVCCTVTLTNGATTSLNESYIVQAAAALTPGAMMYTICPCSDDVCRIRFDFTAFTIAGPVTRALPATGGTTDFAGDAIGDCRTDTFSISSAQGGTPTICGVNTGQHMIVDTNGSGCVTTNFGIGGGTTQRSWDIKVTQYKCGDENGGPTGCLQWHMSPAGKLRSFNFPEQNAAAQVTNSVTHLSDQHYKICIRRPASRNRICYAECRAGGGATGNQGSFGISGSPPTALPPTGGQTAAQSGVGGTTCIDDYVEILGGTTSANAALGTTGGAIATAFTGGYGTNSRFCGRFLNTASGQTATAMVCTASVPFEVGVEFDSNERTSVGASNADSVETFAFPAGIIGFQLCYTTPNP